MTNEEQINIMAFPSQDPQVCHFKASKDFSEDKLKCQNKEEAKGHPFFEALFELEGIKEVLVERAILVLKKSSETSWQVLGKQVGTVIRESFQKGPLFGEGQESLKVHDAPLPEDEDDSPKSEFFLTLDKFIQEKVGPALASHGGTAKLEKIEDDRVHLRFGGGCQGCSQASVTVKQGVEKLIMENFPQIKGVIDVTDHQQGTNPYFR
jgi:Fe-S cluster biogenesis protein NfuA